MGGDPRLMIGKVSAGRLKSTPPAWAGTSVYKRQLFLTMLKSTPPAWAGTSR